MSDDPDAIMSDDPMVLKLEAQCAAMNGEYWNGDLGLTQLLNPSKVVNLERQIVAIKAEIEGEPSMGAEERAEAEAKITKLEAKQTMNAVTAYVSLTPHWAYCGSARRYWDYVINSKTSLGNEREVHHYVDVMLGNTLGVATLQCLQYLVNCDLETLLEGLRIFLRLFGRLFGSRFGSRFGSLCSRLFLRLLLGRR